MYKKREASFRNMLEIQSRNMLKVYYYYTVNIRLLFPVIILQIIKSSPSDFSLLASILSVAYKILQLYKNRKMHCTYDTTCVKNVKAAGLI